MTQESRTDPHWMFDWVVGYVCPFTDEWVEETFPTQKRAMKARSFLYELGKTHFMYPMKKSRYKR